LLVKGRLNRPHVALDTSSIVAKIGAAIALGTVLTPAASILPFLEAGLGKEGACYSHITQLMSLRPKTAH